MTRGMVARGCGLSRLVDAHPKSLTAKNVSAVVWAAIMNVPGVRMTTAIVQSVIDGNMDAVKFQLSAIQ